jgi:hypothetical protein
LPPFHPQTIPKTLADEMNLSLRVPGPRPGVGNYFELVGEIELHGPSS